MILIDSKVYEYAETGELLVVGHVTIGLDGPYIIYYA